QPKTVRCLDRIGQPRPCTLLYRTQQLCSLLFLINICSGQNSIPTQKIAALLIGEVDKGFSSKEHLESSLTGRNSHLGCHHDLVAISAMCRQWQHDKTFEVVKHLCSCLHFRSERLTKVYNG